MRLLSVARRRRLADAAQRLHEPVAASSRRCSSRCSSSPRSPAASRGSRTCPGFDFPSGYTAFQFVFVLLQSAAFGGVFTGFGIARDFESGFARRLLLAAPHRTGIVLGYAVAALVRWVVTATILTVVALAVGMQRRRQRRRPRRPLRARGCSSTSPRCSGRRASRCGCARCRPGRSCRCRSS